MPTYDLINSTTLPWSDRQPEDCLGEEEMASPDGQPPLCGPVFPTPLQLSFADIGNNSWPGPKGPVFVGAIIVGNDTGSVAFYG